MKKNKVMRIASVLMALALISTCAISGTFAKYVTKAEGTDSARVAKWGILIGLNAGDAFAKEYEHSVKGDGYTGLAVKAEEKVVAPGTNSKEAGASIVGTVNGTPEVATRYQIKISGLKDIILPAGEYTDYTQLVKAEDGSYGYTGKFTLAKDYTPVKWDIKVSNKNGVSYSLTQVAQSLGQNFTGFSFTDAASIMSASNIMGRLMPMLESMASGASNAQYKIDEDDGSITVSMDFEPGTEMDYTFELSWAWAFEDANDANVDKADTLLGNIASGDVELPKGASITIEATVEASATQID